MVLLNIPNFKIEKNNPKNDIQSLLPKIKPLWNVENLIIEEVVGGYSSKMFKCSVPENLDDAIIIRLQNLMDRFEEWKDGIEIQVLEYMSSVGHFPQLHAVFSNGYCYQYIVGKPVINARLKTGKMTEEIVKVIAEELAFVHSTKLPNVNYESVKFFSKMKETVKKMEFKDPPKMAPTKEELCTELDIISNFMDSLESPVVLCHGDPHPGNFVWNDDTKKITFVDWEMTRIGHEFHEVAHFMIMIMMFASNLNPTNSIEVPDDVNGKFTKFYFEARSKYKNLKEYSFEDYKLIVEKFKLCTLLCGVIWPLILPDLLEEFSKGSMDFYEAGINGYLQTKKAFLGTDRFG